MIVIHIPSPLSVYKLVLPKGPLLLQRILSQEGKYETRLKKIKNVGNATCIEIERITKILNFWTSLMLLKMLEKRKLFTADLILIT